MGELRRFRSRTMAIAMVALLAGSIAAALGARLVARWSRPAAAAEPRSDTPGKPETSATPEMAGEPALPAVGPVPPVEPAAMPAPVAAPAPATAPTLRLPARGLRQLRQSGDPHGALARLDERDRRFGGDPLARDATLARAEALLALDDQRSALGLLDGLPRDTFLPDGRLALLRGELRARAGRCTDAIDDFDRAIGGTPTAAIGLRARAARARCLETSAAPGH